MRVEKNIRLLRWYNFFADFRLYAPVAILYFAAVSGSYALGMAVFSTLFLSQTIFEVPTGILSDKFLKRKGSMIAGAAASAVGVALYAYAPNYMWLLAGSVLEGLSRAFCSGTDEALLYETLQETGRKEEFHHQQGKALSMFHFSALAGTLLGAAAILHSYQLAFALSVIPQVICCVIACFFVEPARHTRAVSANVYAHAKEALAWFARNPRLRWFSVATVVGYSFGEASYQFQAAYVRNIIPDWAISLVRGLANCCAAFGFWFAGKLIDVLGYFKIFFGGTLCSGIVQLGALALNNIATPFLFTLTSLVHGVDMTAESSLLQKEFTDEQRATIRSFISLCGSLGFVLVAVFVGYVADLTSPWMALLVAYLLQKTIIAPIYWRTLRNG